MTAAKVSKIILNIVEFLGNPISVLRCIPRNLRAPDLNWGLNFFLCRPKIDFLRDCQLLMGVQMLDLAGHQNFFDKIIIILI